MSASLSSLATGHLGGTRRPGFPPRVQAASLNPNRANPAQKPPSGHSTNYGVPMPITTSPIPVNFCEQSHGERWAGSLRKRFRTAKHAARALDAAVATADGWWQGQPPQGKHMARAAEIDPQILADVYAPGHEVVPAGSDKARLHAAIEAADKLTQAAQELRALIERIERG
jgi:hypothetical protein